MLRFGPRYSGLASWTKRQSRDPSVTFGILMRRIVNVLS